MRAIPGVETDTIDTGLMGVEDETGVEAKLEGDTAEELALFRHFAILPYLMFPVNSPAVPIQTEQYRLLPSLSNLDALPTILSSCSE